MIEVWHFRKECNLIKGEQEEKSFKHSSSADYPLTATHTHTHIQDYDFDITEGKL